MDTPGNLAAHIGWRATLLDQADRLVELAELAPDRAVRELGDLLAAPLADALRSARQGAAAHAVAEHGTQRDAALAIGISEPGLSRLLKDGPRAR